MGGPIRELFAEIAVGLQQAAEREAAGWVYVVVDDESGSHVETVGPFPTPEAALLASEARKAEDVRLNPGEQLWTHHILPMYAP